MVSYVLATQEKLRDMAEIVKENLTRVQKKQKTWYDKDARMREFADGDPVLVLLPTSTSKLLAQWQGPYQVVKRVGQVSYLIDMHDKRKRRRVFHVNMLKAFRVRRPAKNNYWAEHAGGDDNPDDESDVPVWNEVLESNSVTVSQRQELRKVLDEFEEY